METLGRDDRRNYIGTDVDDDVLMEIPEEVFYSDHFDLAAYLRQQVADIQAVLAEPIEAFDAENASMSLETSEEPSGEMAAVRAA